MRWMRIKRSDGQCIWANLGIKAGDSFQGESSSKNGAHIEAVAQKTRVTFAKSTVPAKLESKEMIKIAAVIQSWTRFYLTKSARE